MRLDGITPDAMRGISTFNIKYLTEWAGEKWKAGERGGEK